MIEVAEVPIETVIGRLRDIAPALRAAGVTRLTLFGSRARVDARPDSDLDALVETTARGGLPRFDFFKVLHLTEDATGLRVQLSMREMLRPRVAERIADDLIEVL
ncbi:nucleotidyltransferase domain-containing protein [Bradyrhizobium jicamae]|uniref:Nucleotidyltransferase domain-containing protein n=1 Tax=Bradyrhizobium jicamae TaxID=280332 RepID=A0ABS5FNW6_9BRAD|nr:nucleotidyltransferase domain-containing protein [Bradyrhizobium jicamae]MBR0798462.1 nucleotidyltransferase domain-containing protein [Bradyrhizobium jicamae]